MKRLILITLGIVLVLNTPVAAQQASQNIPVLPVITEADDDLWYLKGDGYLQRQVGRRWNACPAPRVSRVDVQGRAAPLWMAH